MQGCGESPHRRSSQPVAIHFDLYCLPAWLPGCLVAWLPGCLVVRPGPKWSVGDTCRCEWSEDAVVS